VELYEQVAGTTDETKKYYTMYNTLQNTKDFIVKESKVMDRRANRAPIHLQRLSLLRQSQCVR
jgi:hypothetical protein